MLSVAHLVPRPGKHLVVIVHVHRVGESPLFQVVEAGDLLGLGFGLGQCGQQHRGQNGNDGNDHQQFNQCETAGFLMVQFHNMFIGKTFFSP